MFKLIAIIFIIPIGLFIGTIRAFLNGLSGRIPCQGCDEMRHVTELDHGYCEDCAAWMGLIDSVEIEEHIEFYGSHKHGEPTGIVSKVGINDDGIPFIVDYSDRDNPQWKVIGYG